MNKTIVNHLKLILLDIIDNCESVYFHCRIIIDNVLIAFDVFHSKKIGCKQG